MIVSVTLTLGLYAVGARMIFKSVKHFSEDAIAVYGGDHVGALIAMVEDESAPFDKRNSAIWALGQIGDDRALPALIQLDTGERQEPPYDSTKYIVQYTVEKAIKQIKGITATKWIYHWL